MGMVDMTGKPRSDEELQEAIEAIKVIMVKHSTTIPLLTLNALCILDCLRELQALRLLADVR